MSAENQFGQLYASWESAKEIERARHAELKDFARQNQAELAAYFGGILKQGREGGQSTEAIAEARKFFELKRETSVAVINGNELIVSSVERKILEVLDANRDNPVSSAAFDEAIWGPEGYRPKNVDISMRWRVFSPLKGRVNKREEIIMNMGGRTHTARWMLAEGTTVEFRDYQHTDGDKKGR